MWRKGAAFVCTLAILSGCGESGGNNGSGDGASDSSACTTSLEPIGQAGQPRLKITGGFEFNDNIFMSLDNNAKVMRFGSYVELDIDSFEEGTYEVNEAVVRGPNGDPEYWWHKSEESIYPPTPEDNPARVVITDVTESFPSPNREGYACGSFEGWKWNSDTEEWEKQLEPIEFEAEF